MYKRKQDRHFVRKYGDWSQIGTFFIRIDVRPVLALPLWTAKPFRAGELQNPESKEYYAPDIVQPNDVAVSVPLVLPLRCAMHHCSPITQQKEVKYMETK